MNPNRNHLDRPIVVALYIRVSTEEQAEYVYSIDAQKQALRQYCEETNRVVYEVYCDCGKNGTRPEKRDALQRLLCDAQNGLFQEVIVWKINRLARRAFDLLKIVNKLTDHQVGFRSITESHFDTTTSIGKFSLQMLGALADLERQQCFMNRRSKC
ncbi:recombinase family protein [Paenibacillus sp. GYB004]|uniref:recombinase family protein n=1 Tax=Paenibacillus sp. GYB004 TaxID=2994393 RepID=UPI002F96BB14